MNTYLLNFLAIQGGFIFVGALLTSRVGSWVQAVWLGLKANRETGVPFSPLILVLHSGPWLLLGLLYFSFRLLTGHYAAAWYWLLAGIYLAPVVLLPWAFWYLPWKKRRRVIAQ